MRSVTSTTSDTPPVDGELIEVDENELGPIGRKLAGQVAKSGALWHHVEQSFAPVRHWGRSDTWSACPIEHMNGWVPGPSRLQQSLFRMRHTPGDQAYTQHSASLSHSALHAASDTPLTVLSPEPLPQLAPLSVQWLEHVVMSTPFSFTTLPCASNANNNTTANHQRQAKDIA